MNDYQGFQNLETFGSQFNAQYFLVQSLLANIRTATLVKIVACTNDGGLTISGTVDVQPLVNQVDGAGNMTAHGIIYKCVYSRMQGGANAVIMDPQAGDIGIMIFSDRDTSKVIATKAQANPGSGRTFDMADGIYIGWCLNGIPNQYMQFNSSGIKIVSPTLVNLEAPDVQINAQTVEINASATATVTTPTFTINGNSVLNGTLTQGHGTAGGACSMLGPLTVTNDVTAEGTSVHTHTHGGVYPGSANTTGPN